MPLHCVSHEMLCIFQLLLLPLKLMSQEERSPLVLKQGFVPSSNITFVLLRTLFINVWIHFLIWYLWKFQRYVFASWQKLGHWLWQWTWFSWWNKGKMDLIMITKVICVTLKPTALGWVISQKGCHCPLFIHEVKVMTSTDIHYRRIVFLTKFHGYTL